MVHRALFFTLFIAFAHLAATESLEERVARNEQLIEHHQQLTPEQKQKLLYNFVDRKSFQHHPDSPTAISTDGNCFAAIDRHDKSVIRIWNTNRNSQRSVTLPPDQAVTTLAFSPDEQYLLTAMWCEMIHSSFIRVYKLNFDQDPQNCYSYQEAIKEEAANTFLLYAKIDGLAFSSHNNYCAISSITVDDKKHYIDLCNVVPSDQSWHEFSIENGEAQKIFSYQMNDTGTLNKLLLVNNKLKIMTYSQEHLATIYQWNLDAITEQKQPPVSTHLIPNSGMVTLSNLDAITKEQQPRVTTHKIPGLRCCSNTSVYYSPQSNSQLLFCTCPKNSDNIICLTIPSCDALEVSDDNMYLVLRQNDKTSIIQRYISLPTAQLENIINELIQ